MLHPSSEYPPVYASLRARVRAVVEAADPVALEAIAPTAPAWRVRDVLAHMVGVTSDVIAGRLDGVASDAWTAAQVDARRGASVAEMLDEWDANGVPLSELMPHAPDAAIGQMVFDAVTHEHDIRNALGASGAHDSDAVLMSADWVCAMAPLRTAARGNAIVVEWPGGKLQLGTGEVVNSVRLDSAFELVRSVSGRRSAKQLGAADWSATPEPEAFLLADFFTFPNVDIIE